MREILFRGKRIDNGEWVYGDIAHHDGVISYIGQHPADGSMLCYDLIPETVGQYTGLKDKNGVRIFEGDICQIKNHRLIDDTPFVVEWEGFVYNGWTWRDPVDDSEDSFTNGAAKVCEVIGNIHDTEGGAE